MGYTKEQRILNSISGSTKNKRSLKPSGDREGFVLPNNSGDHRKSIKRDDPINNHDLVNKKYVDDNVSSYTDAEAVAAVATDDAYLKNDGDTATGDYNFSNDTLFIDDSEGRVGIGTTSPNVPLEIKGSVWQIDSASNVEFVQGESAGTGKFGGVVWKRTDDSFRLFHTGTGMMGIESSNANGYIGISTGGLLGTNERVRIDKDGNVGIGTTEPATKLEIDGALTLTEKSSDPSDPAEGKCVLWMSDGTGTGDDGDVLIKITAGGTTKTATLVDFSAV